MKPALYAAVALAALAACDTPAVDGTNRFVTREGMAVTYTTVAAPFTVEFKAGSGARDYWCAAGRAGERIATPTTPIYRVTPTPQPAGSGITFSFTEPPGGGQPSGLPTIGGQQPFLTVSSATQQC